MVHDIQLLTVLIGQQRLDVVFHRLCDGLWCI